MVFLRSAALAFVLGVTAQAAQAADAANGAQIAQRWCATCHVVSGDQRQGTDVPTFAAIARIPNFSQASVAFFLLAPHPRMPDMALSRREVEDIAAYIASLR